MKKFIGALMVLLVLGPLCRISHAQQPLIITPAGDANFSGNVGIGTNSMPDFALVIQGKTPTSNLLLFQDNTGKRVFHFTLNGGGLNLAETSVKDYRWFIQAGTGNVGIGTNATAQKLTVDGNAVIKNAFIGDVGLGPDWAGFASTGSVTKGGYGFAQKNDGTSTYINKKSGGGSIGFRIDNVDKMVIDDQGNVGIGTPKAKLQVAGDLQVGSNPIKLTSGWSGFPDSPNPVTGAEISNDTGSYKSLMIVGNRSSGARTVTIWDRLKVNGPLVVHGQIWTNEYNGQWRHVGTHGTYESGEVPDIKSDVRLKKDLSPIRSPLESIRHLKGVTYKWNDEAIKYFTRDIETTVSAGPDATAEQNQVVWQRERHKKYEELSNTQVGVVAQDVEGVLPQAVTTDASGYKSVKYYELIPLVIEALKEEDKIGQEQARTIDSQQAEIQRLTVANDIAQQQLSELQEVKQKLGYLEASVSRLMADKRSEQRRETTSVGQSAQILAEK